MRMTYFCTRASRHANRSVEISSASFHRVPLFSVYSSPHVLSWADKNMAQKSSHAVWPTSGVITRGCNRTSYGTLEYAKNASSSFINKAIKFLRLVNSCSASIRTFLFLREQKSSYVYLIYLTRMIHFVSSV